jgi:hypothetical protein
MKKPPDNPEFARFTEAMRKIMTVPKSAIQAEKRKPKSASRASGVPVKQA